MTEHSRYLPADERRNATVEAVIALAAQQNPGDITTTAIAQKMGVTQGALFRHFPSKDAILQAVMSWVAQRLLSRVDRAAQAVASPAAALEAVFMAHIDFVSEHPGVPRLIFGELQRQGAHLATVEMALFAFLRDARHPAFRQISALIKQPLAANPRSENPAQEPF